MDEQNIITILQTLEDLGFPSSPVGVLKARLRGLLTAQERHDIFNWMHARGLPRDWFRALVWSAPL